MAVPSFIFGQGTKYKTPEQLNEARRRVQQIMGGIGTAQGAYGWADSLAKGAVAGIKNRRIRQGEQYADEQRQQGNTLFEKLLSGGAGYPSAVASGASPTSAEATGTPVNIPQAPEIRQGLIDRGLPDHVADAFVLNFQDESGLNPAINERNPIVAGSRGGYGLYQLTGPRRREYEAFATQRGVAPSDANAQLDFLMHELQGSEAKAARNILGSKDTASAAQAIVNDFLRPAEQHRAARAERYGRVANGSPSFQPQQPTNTATDAINMIAPPEQGGITDEQFNTRFGGAPMQPQAMQQPDQMMTGAVQQAPQQQFSDSAMQQHDAMWGGALAPQGQAPQQTADTSGAFPPAPTGQPFAQPQQSNRMQEFARLISNPFVPDEQKRIAQMIMQQEMQQSDPMRQLDMEYKRAQIGALNAKASGGGSTEYGLAPQYGTDENGNPVIMQLGKDGTAVKTPLPEGVSLSKEPIRIDAGTHTVLLDPITRQQIGVIPKNLSQAAEETADGKAQSEAKAALPGIEQNATQMLGMIDALAKDPYLDSMLGPINSRTPNISTESARVQSRMDQIGGQTFLQAYNMLRGGGVITDIEGEKATAALARLNTAQSSKDYKAALSELRAIVQNGVDKARRQAGGARYENQSATSGAVDFTDYFNQ